MSIHDSPFTNHGFFVTGTDTGVGKTLVACSLLRAFAAQGLKCVGMKPVASGAERRPEGLVHEDVTRLIAAGNVTAPLEHVNPYCFAPPVAPSIAAEQAGVAIEFERIEHAYRALAARAQIVVVEGVGGFRVPLAAGTDTAQLAARLALPVVLVVGVRLGCLNHALLAAEAISTRRLQLAGWIANHVDPQMAAADENVRVLESLIGARPLARIEFAADPDARAIAATLDTGRLV